MGSYLTIVNNTKDTYWVKVGADNMALKIGATIGVVVGSVAVAAATCGAGAALVAGPATTLTAFNTAVGTAVVGAYMGGIGFGISGALQKNVQEDLEKIMTEHLEKEGYTKLTAEGRHKSGKMSLSLWSQCECIRVRIDGNEAVTERVIMRPIFSGATDGSNNDHDIQWWINKWGGHEELNRTKLV